MIVPSQEAVMEWVQGKHLDTSMRGRCMKLGEEVGEVFGAVVAMSEGLHTKFDLGQEMAQAVMCLKGLAQAAGLDLDTEVQKEWIRMQTREWEHLK